MTLGWAVFSSLALLALFFAIVKSADKPVPQPNTQTFTDAVGDACMQLRQASAVTATSVEDMRQKGSKLKRSIAKEQERKPGDTRRVNA